MKDGVKEPIEVELKEKNVKGKFESVRFSDCYGKKCCIAKNPYLVFKDSILFGLDNSKDKGKNSDTLMCLSKEQVKEIIPVLQKFVDEGEII